MDQKHLRNVNKITPSAKCLGPQSAPFVRQSCKKDTEISILKKYVFVLKFEINMEKIFVDGWKQLVCLQIIFWNICFLLLHPYDIFLIYIFCGLSGFFFFLFWNNIFRLKKKKSPLKIFIQLGNLLARHIKILMSVCGWYPVI